MTAAVRIRRAPAAPIAAIAALAWLALAPQTPDLAAAVYRAGLFARDGFMLYDSAWYGGHHLPGYSLVFPPVAATIGVRLTGAIAAVAAAILFERLAYARWGTRGRLAAAWFAVATCADLLIGRLTFGLGVAVGLGALLALQRGSATLATALAIACAATSPIAGLFLALASCALWLDDRSRRSALVVTCAAAATVGALALAFPEGGTQPCDVGALAGVLVSAGLVVLLTGPGDRALRIGAALYALAGVASFLLATPMGGNIGRLGTQFAGPLLVGTLAVDRSRIHRLAPAALVATTIALVVLQWWAPVRELAKGGDPSYEASFHAPLLRYLDRHASGPTRIEIPFTRGHWESVHVAPRYPLARGWQTQLDVRYGAMFYGRSRLDAATYRDWLRRNAVAFVALPRAPLDPSGRAEAKLVRTEPSYLRRVWSAPDWTVYRVVDPAPLVSGPARLVALRHDSFALRATGVGHADVRVRWTPYWHVAGGGCVRRAPGGWTRVALGGARTVRVETRFSLARIGARKGCS